MFQLIIDHICLVISIVNHILSVLNPTNPFLAEESEAIQSKAVDLVTDSLVESNYSNPPVLQLIISWGYKVTRKV